MTEIEIFKNKYQCDVQRDDLTDIWTVLYFQCIEINFHKLQLIE